MVLETFRWWLVIEGIGLVALPIALLLFQSLPGRGIAFAKPLGLLLSGYLFWLALSAHILPNRPGSVVWVLLALVAVDYLILRARWPELKQALAGRWRLIVSVEVIFTLGFFIAAHLRSYIPEIGGTEKPMDFMLLNAAGRSTYYPPEDPWLSGFGVSYYYFGYVIQAMVGKLSAVSSAVAFNLALAGTAALAATAAFGLAYELVRALPRFSFKAAAGAGLGAVMLVLVMGNLEGVLEFGAANNALPSAVVDAVDIANLEDAPESDACLLPVVCINYPTDSADFWWWWRATRISPDAGTITEFPFFSFVLGDLHPHVMAIPFVLTATALGLSFWRRDAPLNLDTWRNQPLLLPAAGVLLGGLAFLNTWDLPAFGFLIALLVLARNLTSGRGISQALKDTAWFVIPLGLLAVLLYAPFYVSFSSQAGFLDAVTQGATRPVQAILFWGPLAVLALALPAYTLLTDPASRSAPRVRTVALLPVVLLVLWAALLVVRHGLGELPDAITARGWNWLTALFFAASLGASLLVLWRSLEVGDEEQRPPVPVLAAMSTAWLLVLGAEFFFVEDVFGSRLNSVFKLYYQAWILLGVSSAAGIWWLGGRIQLPGDKSAYWLRGAWAGIAVLAVAGAMLYPLGATLSRTEGLARTPRTLDGLEHRRTQGSGDLALADWLRRNADPGERIVEAVGPQYSDAGRISAWTGLPTILGWPGHERQWGRDPDLLALRERDVEAVFTGSLEDSLAILQQYDVTYIVVGDVERRTYSEEALAKFESGLQQVVSSGDSSLYRVPPSVDVPVEGVGLAR